MMIQVASHQVQLASLVESCKRRQLLSRHSPVAQVLTLGESFTIGDEAWSGTAILSPDALFLLKLDRRPGESRQNPEANLQFCPKPLLTVRYTELPLPIIEDEGWPKPPGADCEVAILMRDEAQQVRAVPFTTQLEFLSDSPRVRVNCSSTAAAMAITRLKNAGWIREAPAQAANEVAAPPAAPAGRKDRSAEAIILGILAFIFLTIIAVKLDSLSTQLAMVLCIPAVALLGYGLLRLARRWPPSMSGRGA